MRISRAHWNELVAHARAEEPNECCGYLSANEGVVERIVRSRNLRASPYGYELDPRSLLAANELDDEGFEVGIYHSHPRSPAEPSQTDINLALAEAGGERVQLFPGTIYLIASLAEGERALRGFDIAADDVREVELEIL